MLGLASGCATVGPTPPLLYQQFAVAPGGVTDAQLCSTWVHANDTDQAEFEEAVYKEASRRSLTFSECVGRTKRQDDRGNVIRNVLIGAAVVGLAVALARRGGGGGGYAPTVTDYSWSWDLFYNEYRQLVWACRGEQTGQFAELNKCQFKPKNDHRWPSLEAPQ